MAAGEQGGPSHLEDLGHVFRVPLLCDIAQLGRDIDSAADVHVHLHGLFLDLCVQVCHGLQGGQQGLRERGTEQVRGWDRPWLLGGRWEAPEAKAGPGAFPGCEGLDQAARLGGGAGWRGVGASGSGAEWTM